jgi:hypothetical protein
MAFALTLLLALPAAAGTGERIDQDVNWRIRKEGIENSQIMRTMHFLTDVYGPRLTGSPNLEAAGQWALRQMRAWGLQNAHAEPWAFGRPGWLNDRFSGFIVSPVKDTLTGEVLAWTPGTNGTLTGKAVQLVPPGRPTKEALASYLATIPVTKRMVLVGRPATLGVAFHPPAKRREDADVRRALDPDAPSPFGPPRGVTEARGPGVLSTNEITEQIDAHLVRNGALVRINDAGRDHGQIRAFQNRTYDPARAVPTVVLRNEDFGRISRILANDVPVELEFTIVNRLFPEGKTSNNFIAEIPGTDRKEEVVMLGGHLDSWHAATGATDNAIGCAVMMEAARILQAIGVKPRRTIRVALWSGEEQGLLGSKAYVAEHFGSFEEPKPEFHTFAGYLNIDSGTGRARAATVFGPAAAGDVLKQVLSPFEDLGILGASTTRSRRTGGTDSTSFNAAGLPGIGMTQDPIEYQTHTWHTNLDTYERIVEEDAQKSAIVIAAAVYHLALRDELLPRFGKEDMPPPATTTPARRTTTGGQR